MTAWPTTLPNPTKVSTAAPNRSPRAKMYRGSRKNQNLRKIRDTFTLTFVFNSVEYEIYKTFFNVDLQKGSLWFDIYLSNGASENLTTIRITKPPEDTDQYPLMSVQLAVEAQDKYVISLSAVDAALGA